MNDMNKVIYNENVDRALAREFLLEKAKKEKYANNTWSYLKRRDPRFFKDERIHLRFIADLFDDLDSRVFYNLGFSFPRRYGKSYTTSHCVSISIGRHPEGSNMRNAYAASKAEDYSRDTKNFIQHPFYQEVFPNIKFGNLTQLHKWNLKTSLEHAYTCAGVDGALTGSGCDNLLVGDDLIRNMSDAQSDTVMDRLEKFKSSVHESSMEGDCAHMEIGTRWTRKDPQGEIQANEKHIRFDVLEGDDLSFDGLNVFRNRIKTAIQKGNFDPQFDWILVNIPALDLNGNSTCESIRSTKWFRKRRETLYRRGQEYIWDSMYQGVPYEAKGLMFPEEKLKTFRLEESEYLFGKTVAYCDYASRGKDYHVVLIAKIYGKKVFILDALMTKKGSKFHFPKTMKILNKYRPSLSIFESNHGGEEYHNRIKDHMPHLKTYLKYNTMEKMIRINFYSGDIIDNFYFLPESDYLRDSDYAMYKNHLTNFKKEGKNSTDDPEDATAGLAEHADKGSGVGVVDVDLL